MDWAEEIHRSMYGKSDKINAKENQNIDFQNGFAFGRKENKDSLDLITEEWNRRGQPKANTKEGNDFKRWKEGFWAATFQKISI